MTKIVTHLFLAALVSALGACDAGTPVATNAVAPPDNVVGDAPASGLAAPANSGAAEAVAKASMPLPTDGMHWHWNEAAGSADYGGGPGAITFSIACRGGTLLFHRLDAAPKGGKGTISFTGNARAASVPAVAVGDTAAMTSSWLASEAPSDMTSAVARVFAGPGPVEIALTGTMRLVTKPSPIPMKPFALCRT